MKKKKKKKKVRFKYKNILIFLAIVFGIYFIIHYFMTLKISNIFISGNTIYKDQEIIRIAHLEDYPPTFINSSNKIEKKLESDKFILSANVKKKKLTETYIEIVENYPLYYYNGKTILYNKEELDEVLNAPTLINEVPDNIKLVDGLKKIDRQILDRISEIKYTPDAVDPRLFRFTMIDGNYTFITLSKIEKVNNYVELVKEFNNQVGTLYLNSGEYFKIN